MNHVKSVHEGHSSDDVDYLEYMMLVKARYLIININVLV
jgi:hypothetical protein